MTEDQNEKITQILHRLDEVELRNRRVEMNKAWEVSATRKISVLLATYIAMIILFHSLENDRPFSNAIVPTLGFFLSTLSLPVVRGWWKKRFGKDL